LVSEDVENHHGLCWNHGGVLEEPHNKMNVSRRSLKPEYVNNFSMPLDSMMSIPPLIYLKIISRELTENAQIKLELQFKKMGKRTISGCRWTHHATFIEILQFYGIFMMMALFPLPGALYTAYWTY
jgi:hypothetical protein